MSSCLIVLEAAKLAAELFAEVGDRPSEVHARVAACEILDMTRLHCIRIVAPSIQATRSCPVKGHSPIALGQVYVRVMCAWPDKAEQGHSGH
eukprot:2939954-Amphidinium_carterae.2